MTVNTVRGSEVRPQQMFTEDSPPNGASTGSSEILIVESAFPLTWASSSAGRGLLTPLRGSPGQDLSSPRSAFSCRAHMVSRKFASRAWSVKALISQLQSLTLRPQGTSTSL